VRAPGRWRLAASGPRGREKLVACHPAAIQLVLHIDAHQTNLPYIADSGEHMIAFGADISDQRK
jgi:hypothetical protein